MRSILHHRTNRSFTLMELLVGISIIAILASLFMPAMGSAVEAGNRTETNSKMKAILAIVDYRFTGKRLADYTFYTQPPSKAIGGKDFSMFIGPRNSTGFEVLDPENHWLTVNPNQYFQLNGWEKLDLEHPIDPENGHFLYFGSFVATSKRKSDNLSDLWISEKRKIAIDVYNFQEEGDGLVSVGFADGHVGVEETELLGLPDKRSTLVGTATHSYKPGTLKHDL